MRDTQRFPDIPFTELYIEGKRHYVTPTGKRHKSVTTTLGEMFDKSHLDQWRKRVGEEEATAITKESSDVGTIFHDSCEKYLHEESWRSGNSRVDRLVMAVVPYLKKISGPLTTEAFLYDDEMLVAGRTDVIGYYDGNSAIIDFKNSRKPKQRSWIESYFYQEAMYGIMSTRLYDFRPKKLVTIIGNWSERPDVFIEDFNDIYPKMLCDLTKYHYGERGFVR